VNHVAVYSDITIFYGYDVSSKIIGEEAISFQKEQEEARVHGAIIKSDILHGVKGCKGLTISICVDPESKTGRELNRLVKNGILFLGVETANTLFNYFNTALATHLTEADMKVFLLGTLRMNDGLSSPLLLDDRIEKVIAHIRASSNYAIKFADLLTICALSESRLIHLFKKETGITIRKYILWCRIQKALKAMASGNSIKQSASIAGFTDVAHLSRTFASMFGVSPSSIFK
jgi:AraC-like DNA-binding protein